MVVPTEWTLPRGLARLLRSTAGLSGTMGAGLFLASAHTKDFFAWQCDSPITAATLGAGYLAGALLLWLASRARRWSEVRLCLLAAWVQMASTGAATFMGHDFSGFNDGLVALGTGIGFRVFHVVAPLTLLVGMGFASRNAGEQPERQQVVAAWVFAGLYLPGALATAAGVAALSGAEFFPWATWGMDAPALGAWLLAAGIATAGAAFERDFQRLRVLIWASLCMGVLLAINVLRYPEAGLIYGLSAGSMVALGASGLMFRAILPSD